VDSLSSNAAGLRNLQNAPQLQELHLFGGASDSLVNYLASGKNGPVSMSMTPEAMQEVYAGLAACKQLSLLELHCCDCLVIGQEHFSAAVVQLRGLRALDITSTHLGEVMLQLPLQGLVELTSLRIDGGN
jgi:hypothetical protein